MEELLSSPLPDSKDAPEKTYSLFKAQKKEWARRKKAEVVRRSMFHHGYRQFPASPSGSNQAQLHRSSLRLVRARRLRRSVVASSTVPLLRKISLVLSPSPIPEQVAALQETILSRSLVWLLAIACGLSSACLIYAQPLLASISHSFSAPISQIGFIPMLGQIGYAVGLIFIVPLGEIFNQRRLILIMLCAVAVALVFMAVAYSLPMLVISSTLVGVTSIVPELIIPFAARQVSSKERGRIVGMMLCGFLIGTPLANLLSGVLGAYLGWRMVYWFAAALMLIFAALFRFLLPNDLSTTHTISYSQILLSLWTLLRTEPVLQEISILGMLVYAAFTAFWVTLSFLLQTPPYHYGSDVAGVFGLVGFAGALAALWVGKFTDKHDPRIVMGWALVLVLLSFLLMWFTGQKLIGLIFGTLFLDLGVQSHQTANEARIYRLESSAWNRLNAIYILLFSFGGALGAWLGAIGWSLAGANGVYGSACILLILACGIYFVRGKCLHLKSVSCTS